MYSYVQMTYPLKTREGTLRGRQNSRFQVFITNELNKRHIQYTVLTGSVEQRLLRLAATLCRVLLMQI